MRDQGVRDVSLGDCARLVSFFDSDHDNMLSFADFSQMVLPCEDQGLRNAAMSRPYSRVGRFDTLDHEVELVLARLISHEVDVMRRSQCLVRDLERMPDFSIQGAFRMVDTFGEGKINV
jgi:cytochrome c peroxidase